MFHRLICFSFCLLLLIILCGVSVSAQKASRAQLGAELATLREQIADREAVFLAPDAEDLAKYSAYAQSQDGGVIRIMPRERHAKFLSIREGGSFYSFATRSNDYGEGSDLTLDTGWFRVGFAGADFGFVRNLGDLPLESISLESDPIKDLAAYTPPTDEPGARIEQQKLHHYEKGDGTHVDRVRAVVGQTYAVRSIVYNRSDVLAVFRVVRRDDDGSLILVWKLLQRYPAIKLLRPRA
jgi:hypothetical protein